jgi:parallel beta-helix repeat protein
MKKLAACLLLLTALSAGAQWHLNFPTQAACADAAASVVGPAGGATTCTTSRTVSIPVPVSITAHGAKCDGADDHAAITRAISAAKAKALPVLIPAGSCAYSDVIHLDGVKLTGTGDASALFALNPLRSAIVLQGTGAEVRSLRLTGNATARGSTRESSRIVAHGATKWMVDGVLIDNAAGAGIRSDNSSNGTVSNNRITGTLADSIHITDRSSYITVTGNTIRNSGDDGIAVVSYKPQGGVVHHVTAKGNTISDNKGGRSMSVVGGSDVLYEGNRMTNNVGAACLYLAQEASYNTYPVSRFVGRYNTLATCGNPAIGHAAVMLFTSGTAGDSNTNVTLTRNDISQAARGIRVFGSNTGVVLDSNKIDSPQPLVIQIEGVRVVPYSTGLAGVQ